MIRSLSAVLTIISLSCCADTSIGTKPDTTEISPDPIYTPVSLAAGFNAYWYQGKAEICTYEVEQNRYGENRKAEQINIFVTEDFSKKKQVKLDDPASAGADRVPVLKLNSLRRFVTGIYDYSLMQSVFTPVSGHPTLKVSSSIQDWCGHVFMQANLSDKGYRIKTNSYFESEGDQESEAPFLLLEDELWGKIRLNPAAIKSGNYKVLPATWHVRLHHKPLTAQDANIQITQKNAGVSTLSLNYTSINRQLLIDFESNFPYKILAWEEKNDGTMVSRGTLKASRNSAYWAEHDNIHAPLRDSIKISQR